jgi:hypothetical protein
VKIMIHIEQLSLEGMAAGATGEAALRAALTRELRELVMRDASDWSGLSAARVPRLASEQSATGTSPASLGISVAGSLHACLRAGLGGGGQVR